MGVFIICWLPFFIYNVITGIFKASLSKSHEFIYSIFTWFGYMNSGCNPIIYAFSSRDFRRAFSKILCPASFLRNNKRFKRDMYYTSNTHNDLSSNAISQNKKALKNTCPVCQMYENSLFTLTSKAVNANSLNEPPTLSRANSKNAKSLDESITPPLPHSNDFRENCDSKEAYSLKIPIITVESIDQVKPKSSSFDIIRRNLKRINNLMIDKEKQATSNSAQKSSDTSAPVPQTPPQHTAMPPQSGLGKHK